MPNGSGWEVSTVHYDRQITAGWTPIGGSVGLNTTVTFRGGFSVANGTPGSPIETGTGSFQTYQGGAWVELTFVHVVIPGYSTIEGGEPITYPPVYVTDEYTMAQPGPRRFRFVVSWVDGDWASSEIVLSVTPAAQGDVDLLPRAGVASMSSRSGDASIQPRSGSASLSQRSGDAEIEQYEGSVDI